MKNYTDKLFDEIWKESGYREIWSLKPFDEGCIYDYYPPGQLPKHGETDPLPDSKIALIIELMGGDCSFNLEHLRAFLQTECNVQNFSGMTLKEICIVFGRYRNKAIEGAGKNTCKPDGFEFQAGQTKFDGIDLELKPPCIEILQKLHEQLGTVVPSEELELVGTKYQHYIGTIRRSFEKHNVPFKIETITNVGYKIIRS